MMRCRHLLMLALIFAFGTTGGTAMAAKSKACNAKHACSQLKKPGKLSKTAQAHVRHAKQTPPNTEQRRLSKEKNIAKPKRTKKMHAKKVKMPLSKNVARVQRRKKTRLTKEKKLR